MVQNSQDINVMTLNFTACNFLQSNAMFISRSTNVSLQGVSIVSSAADICDMIGVSQVKDL